MGSTDDEALGRDAALSAVDEPRLGGGAGRGGDIGIGQDDERIAPPSSSTLFFNARPAWPPTAIPAGSLPVRVTATMRASAISPSTAADPTSSGAEESRREPRVPERRPRCGAHSAGRSTRA